MVTKAQSTDAKADGQPESTGAVTQSNVSPEVPAEQPTNVTGRAVFAVETTAAGVVVRTAFLTEENKLLNMPAVFPDLVYAINVIDDLKRQVMQHFSQAAQVGAQVISSQARAQQQQQEQEKEQEQEQQQQPQQVSTVSAADDTKSNNAGKT